MTDRQIFAEADRIIAQANSIERKARRAGKIILYTALAAGVVVVAVEAHSVTEADAAIRGEVDVCVMKSDTPKSWTKGLEKKANKAFSQRVDVHRIAEDDFEGCEVVVWTGGRVALDYITGKKASNPRYHVYTGEYAMAQAEINVGRVTPKKKRPATLVKALREAGVR